MLARAFDLAREHPRRTLLILALVSLALRLALILARQTWLEDFSRTDQGQIANNVVKGKGYTFNGYPSSFFGPAFTYLWAGALAAWGVKGQLLIQVAQAVGLSACPLLLYPFARLYFARDAALLAGAWLAFYPELLALSSTMFAESLNLFLWCACLGTYAAMARSPRVPVARAALLGVLIALMALTKGRMLPFAAVLLAAVALTGGHRAGPAGWAPSRARLGSALLIAGVALACMAPWIARNHRVHDRLLLTESSGGFNLWLGHNPHATGTGKYRLSVSSYGGAGEGEEGQFPRSPALAQELEEAPSEIARDDVYRREALAAVRADPGREVSLSLRKAFYAWFRDPTNRVATQPAYVLPWLATLALLAVGLGRRILAERRWDWLLLSVLALSTALQVVFFVIPRLKYPVYPIVALYAGHALALLTSRFGRADRSPPAALQARTR